MGTPHYETLTPHERFALMIEAMARGDDVEADRLADSCPQFTYRCDDAEFRDRMKRAYHIATAVALNMRAGLARVEMAENFRRLSDHFADGAITLAQSAFLYGRAYGHWEGGKIDSIELPDRERHAAKVRANPLLERQLEELSECGREVTRRLADILHYAVGEADAVDLLSQWEGFERFCRERLGADPLTTSAAFLSGRKDVAAELAALFPNAKPDEAEAARWAAEWTRGWDRRFGGAPA